MLFVLFFAKNIQNLKVFAEQEIGNVNANAIKTITQNILDLNIFFMSLLYYKINNLAIFNSS